MNTIGLNIVENLLLSAECKEVKRLNTSLVIAPQVDAATTEALSQEHGAHQAASHIPILGVCGYTRTRG